MKKIVIPGQKIEEDVNEHVYEEDGEKYSRVYGMLHGKDGGGRIIPLSSKYIPKEGDKIIAIVESVKYGGCVVDINSPYDCFLPTDNSYEVGDVVSTTVENVDEVMNIDLGDDRKFYGGEIIEINPTRTKRVIGKEASMVSLIKEKTDSKIFVGRNGRIWIKGGNKNKAEKAIFKIEEETHKTGLTEEMEKYLTEGEGD